ncbi:replicative helicase loader/inhibitor [Natroniella sulfidigena]|uniref:replicative helicase loader/inhibitor n=1 Tax=Natroniella sulfidigena TaxID=723921 RepID=UPI00200A114F|nr:replicative helicase loader/inhibitor [Natroniella sulfidigena]MCK8817172.1 replicative helicase loader/inhibitor [Natroniella sulfidigena]
MTKTETAKILSILSLAYQKFEVDRKGVKLNFWYQMLKDFDYQEVQVAVQKLVAEQPFIPTIADIRKAVLEVTTEDRLTPAGAWGEVIKAIEHYGYWNKKEALKSLDPLVAKTVDYMGWREICTETNTGVIRGQFIKMYKQLKKREKKDNIIPDRLQGEIDSIASSQLLLD